MGQTQTLVARLVLIGTLAAGGGGCDDPKPGSTDGPAPVRPDGGNTDVVDQRPGLPSPRTGCGYACGAGDACCACGAKTNWQLFNPSVRQGLHLDVKQALPVRIALLPAVGKPPFLEIKVEKDGPHQVLRNGAVVEQLSRELKMKEVELTVDLVPHASAGVTRWDLAVGLDHAELLFDLKGMPDDLLPVMNPVIVIDPAKRLPEGFAEAQTGTCENPAPFIEPSVAGGLRSRDFSTWMPPPPPPLAIGGAALVGQANEDAPDKWLVFLHTFGAQPTPAPSMIVLAAANLSQGSVWRWGLPGTTPIYCETGWLREPSVVANPYGGYDLVAALSDDGQTGHRLVLIEDATGPINARCGTPVMQGAAAVAMDPTTCVSMTSPSLLARPPNPGGHVIFYACHRAGGGTEVRAAILEPPSYKLLGAPETIAALPDLGAPMGYAELGVVEAVRDGRDVARERYVVFFTSSGGADAGRTIYRRDAVRESGGWSFSEVKVFIHPGSYPPRFAQQGLEDIAATRLGSDSRRLLLVLSMRDPAGNIELYPILREQW